MGVYIKGMEMPKSCPCELIGIGYDLCCSFAGGIPARLKEYYECCQNDTRPFWCPLIPVPKHGRLIDKDVMCKECRSVAEEYDGIYPDCTYCPANLAPTIIPADHIGEANEMVADKEGEG